MDNRPEKSVLIIGGGVAALAAAVALVESNKNPKNDIKFKIHILTQAHRWGGRASSWHGSLKGPHMDLTMWPEDCVMNHGFHAVFHERTYANFWPTFSKPWEKEDPPGSHQTLKSKLCSNRGEVLVYERILVRLENEGLLVGLKNFVRLMDGGWHPWELVSFRNVIVDEVNKYRTFKDLHSGIDRYANDEFRDWCVKKGLESSVFRKQLFKMIYDLSYVSPYPLDAAAALESLWGTSREGAAEWFYIDGGITQQIMDPLAEYLRRSGYVTWTMLMNFKQFCVSQDKNSIEGFVATPVKGHPDRSLPDSSRPTEVEELSLAGLSGLLPHKDAFGVRIKPCDCVLPFRKTIKSTIREKCDDPSQGRPANYYISTLPIDNFWSVIKASEISSSFPKVEKLATDPQFPRPVATVNLQAWFKKKVVPDDWDNVVAGLEPLCVLVDYKNLLSTYKDDNTWPGSVLEINGSAKELENFYPLDYKNLGKPQEPGTISFAIKILKDIAQNYGLPDLLRAVETKDFLVRDDWPGRTPWDGKKIPPLLWINSHDHNGFFVTAPGMLQYRPEIKTPYENLFLAGDWTKNGVHVPSMETAARSGRMAALEVQIKAGCTELIQVYDPQ
jgi:hypothetical protein